MNSTTSFQVFFASCSNSSGFSRSLQQRWLLRSGLGPTAHVLIDEHASRASRARPSSAVAVFVIEWLRMRENFPKCMGHSWWCQCRSVSLYYSLQSLLSLYSLIEHVKMRHDWSLRICFSFQSCDPVRGDCQCKAGFIGLQCNEPCQGVTFGPGCNQTCACLNGASCDSVTGKCNCADGFVGTK